MNGIVNVYKEQGYTSFDVVAKLRGIFGMKKIGHTGTLDPMAEGVLPVCLGNATKLCGLLTDKDKEYVTSFKLGIMTDTQDITGVVTKSTEVECTEEEIRTCILSFLGEIPQLTPMYSARKVNGKKLYEYARQGIEVERKTNIVKVYSIDILNIDMDNYIVSMRVACEKGTYIRTLCNDIGEKLGCGATMTELKRTRVDMFDIDKSLKLSEIQLLKEAGRLDTAVLPTDIVFLKYEKVTVDSSLLKQVLNGNKLAFDTFKYIPSEDEKIRLYDESGNFLALYIRTGEELKVCGMFC